MHYSLFLFTFVPVLIHLKRIILLLFVFGCSQLFAQSTYFRVDDERVNFYMDYLDVKGKHKKIHTELKPFLRTDLVKSRWYDTPLKLRTSELPKDLINRIQKNLLLNYTYSETKDSQALRDKPILKTFYKTESEFLHYGGKDFDVFVNPVIGFESGSNSVGNYSRNSRGAEIKGHIGNKIGFYTYLTDNQVRYPEYLSDKINEEGVVPRQGFWKPFKKDGFDYFDARGYITFSPIKQVKMAFGNDRNFIGNGYRSLILSDYAKDYLNLKIQTNVGKVSYQNLFMELHNYSPLLGNTLLPKKYAATHRLGVNLGDWGNIGLFESIIFSRGDSMGNQGGFDFAYLNPIIFYRSVEQNLGSKDNAILGLDFKANIKRRLSFYSQFVLDEFRLEHIKANDGWWANKYGIQAGLKYFNILGTDFHAQVEYNMVRPYTYAHTFQDQSYSHYGQPLAHPLGANFEEFIGIVRWVPSNTFKKSNRLFVTGKIILANKGSDSSLNNTSNYGGNIFASNGTRVQEFDNVLLQGVQQKLTIASVEISYMPWHNIYLDFSVHSRNLLSDLKSQDSDNSLIRVALRYNIGRLKLDF